MSGNEERSSFLLGKDQPFLSLSCGGIVYLAQLRAWTTQLFPIRREGGTMENEPWIWGPSSMSYIKLVSDF